MQPHEHEPAPILLHVPGALAARARLMLATVAIAVPVILMLPKQYTASTSLGVETKSPDAITTLLMPTNLASQEEIIRSERVTRRGDRDAGVRRRPAAARELAAGERRPRALRGLAGGAAAAAPHRDPEPARRQHHHHPVPRLLAAEAAAAANAFAKHYADAAIEMKVEPARQYARWFGEQNKQLRAELEAAQARLLGVPARQGHRHPGREPQRRDRAPGEPRRAAHRGAERGGRRRGASCAPAATRCPR